MARKQKVSVWIEAKDGASRAFKKVETSAKGLGSYLKVNFKMILGATTVALAAVTAAVVKFGKEAYEQERNIKRLEAALKPLGSAARGVRDDLLEQAGALAKLTGESDTTIISMQALLAQMGVQGPKIAQAAQASVDLSAALGIDLNSAARNVGKTMGGFAGELGELIPELKNLSTEALQAGEGIDLLTDKFGGAAEAARTGAAAFGELGNAMGDWGRNMVSIIANNREVMELVDALAAAIRQLTPEFEHQEDVLSSWRDVNIDVNDTISLQIGAIKDWLREIGKSPAEVESFLDNLQTMTLAGYSVRDAFEAMVKSWERAIEIQKRMDEVTKSLGTSLSALGVKLSKNLNEELGKLDTLMGKVTEQYRNGEISARDYEVAAAAIAAKQKELRIELEGSTEAIEDNTAAVGKHRVALDADSDSTDRNTNSVNSNTRAIGEQAVALERSRRIREEGVHGSRLSSSPGGGMFNPEQRSYVTPDGRIVFV